MEAPLGKQLPECAERLVKCVHGRLTVEHITCATRACKLHGLGLPSRDAAEVPGDRTCNRKVCPIKRT